MSCFLFRLLCKLPFGEWNALVSTQIASVLAGSAGISWFQCLRSGRSRVGLVQIGAELRVRDGSTIRHTAILAQRQFRNAIRVSGAPNVIARTRRLDAVTVIFIFSEFAVFIFVADPRLRDTHLAPRTIELRRQTFDQMILTGTTARFIRSVATVVPTVAVHWLLDTLTSIRTAEFIRATVDRWTRVRFIRFVVTIELTIAVERRRNASAGSARKLQLSAAGFVRCSRRWFGGCAVGFIFAGSTVRHPVAAHRYRNASALAFEPVISGALDRMTNALIRSINLHSNGAEAGGT